MHLSERIKLILQEKHLKQVEFGKVLGVSANYINLIVNGKKDNISDTLAKLIEETYGYSSNWIMTGKGDSLVIKDLSSNKLETIKRIKKLNDKEVQAVLAFVNSLEEISQINFHDPN
ncbi:MAG: helix-turn-helix transcriptional regulator [Oscillospiraceae bacterium]